MLFGLDKMIDKILPPGDPMARWRTVMSTVTLGLAAAIAIGWSLVPGLPGFAQTPALDALRHEMEQGQNETKASIARIETTQSVILVRLIASDLESARSNQCKALSEKNTGAAQGWRERLDASLYEYRLSAGRDYPLRPCSEY